MFKVADPLVAYTRYSFFEWGLILLDVVYDSITEIDFKDSNIQVGTYHALHTCLKKPI